MNLFRTPWPDDFPDVIVHTTTKARDAHQDYSPGKIGDAVCAHQAVTDLLNSEAIRHIEKIVKNRNPIFVAAAAIEAGDHYNALPDAMVNVISDFFEFGYDPTSDIRQINKVAHTGQKSFWRFVTPALFGGSVENGRNYFLFDDHIGHGGTLANLRGYIEHHGGHVIGITTLTASREAQQIRLENTTLTMLRSKHGQELEQLWQDTFGYGLDCLTEVEAGHLLGYSDVDTIRRLMAQGAEEARAAGIRPVEEIEN